MNKTKFSDAQYVVGGENTPEALAVIGSADIVYLRYVVMHQKHQKEFVKKIYDAMKPGAILIIQEPEDAPERKEEMVKKCPFSGELWDLLCAYGKDKRVAGEKYPRKIRIEKF